MSEPNIVAAIVTSSEGVLLGQRRDGRPPWTFPAGAAELDESPQQTAMRECLEETGLVVKAGEVIGERDHPKTGRHMVYVACEPANGTHVVVGDPEELVAVAWRPLADLAELMPYGVFDPVMDHLKAVLAHAH